jgi:hypothetical protein
MALEKFNAPQLPAPPREYDPTYFQQLLRAIEIYFGQLDSPTPNNAESYRAKLLFSTPYTVATLPSAATMGAGARAFVSDANATTFASVVAGGGANNVPIYSTGTDWRIG